MQESSEQRFPENQDPTSDMRKDLRAVEALQRYFGAPSNRPAGNARVVEPGQEQTEIVDDGSGFGATDFLGLNAEIEGLTQPEQYQEQGAHEPLQAAPSPAPQAAAATEPSPSWLLEIGDEQGDPRSGERASSEFFQANALETSFVEPETPRERTGRQALRMLVGASILAALFAAWQLTRGGRLDGRREGAVKSPSSVLSTLRSGQERAERYAIHSDGSLEQVPAGAREFGSESEGAREALEEPGELVREEPAQAVAQSEPYETPSEPLSVDSGAGDADAVLRALDELAQAPLDDCELAEAARFPELSLGRSDSPWPFPWPATLVSKLGESAGYGPRWHRAWSWGEPVLEPDPTAGQALVAESSTPEGALGVVSEQEQGVESGTSHAGIGMARGARRTIAASELARWMLLGPEAPAEGPRVASGAQASGGEPVAELTAAQFEAQTELPTEDLPFIEGPAKTYSMLRRVDRESEDHWWGSEVPRHLFESPHQTFTPEVGKVRATTDEGDVLVGRLSWVGRRMVELESERGSIALAVRRLRSLEPLGEDGNPKTFSSKGSVAGLPRVRAMLRGGQIAGFLLEQHGQEVTLVTDSGGRVTVVVESVEPEETSRSLAVIRGRAQN